MHTLNSAMILTVKEAKYEAARKHKHSQQKKRIKSLLDFRVVYSYSTAERTTAMQFQASDLYVTEAYHRMSCSPVRMLCLHMTSSSKQ